METISLLAQKTLRFFLPWACAGCRAALVGLQDDGFCGVCWLAIPRIQGIVCQACGVPLKDGGYSCFSCRAEPPPFPIRAATEYRGLIRPAIHRFKYTGRKTLARPLSLLLQAAWKNYPELHGVNGIVPVPLYPKNERLRGFNQAELLARELSRAIARPMAPILLRSRQTVSQTQLSRVDRQNNIQAAFAVHPLALERPNILKGRSYLLIDDICTTGSTLRECATVLRRAGVRSVAALVLARDL